MVNQIELNTELDKLYKKRIGYLHHNSCKSGDYLYHVACVFKKKLCEKHFELRV